jgi:uncharacterized Fe-S cluster-containing MiaB family protein
MTMAGYNLKDEPWRVKRCRQCGAEIVFVKSKKTGRTYPVNMRGLLDVNKRDVHNCEKLAKEKRKLAARMRINELNADIRKLNREVLAGALEYRQYIDDQESDTAIRLYNSMERKAQHVEMLQEEVAELEASL